MAKQNNISFDGIIREIDARQFRSIYFLYGNEPYYIDKLSDYFEEKVLTEEEKEFNYTLLYGKDITASDIVNNARQYPSFAEYRLTIVREAQEVRDWEAMLMYLKNPLPQSIVVICYKKEKIDARLKVFKEIEKVGLMFQSTKLYDNQIPGWITDYAKSKGFAIDGRSAMILTEFLGNNLMKITNEIDKLAIIMRQRNLTAITPELIEENIGFSKDYNNFELINAIITGEVLKANRIIKYFAANPSDNSIAATTATLFKFFADLMAYQASPNEFISTMHLNPYSKRIQELGIAAKRYSPGRTLYVIEQLRDLDARFKGFNRGNASNLDLLKETVYKIMH